MLFYGTVFSIWLASYSTIAMFDIYLLKGFFSPPWNSYVRPDESAAGFLYLNQPPEQKTVVGLTLLSGAPICMNNSFDAQVWERSTLAPHIWSPLWEDRILFPSEVYKTEKRLKGQSRSWCRPSTSEVCGKKFVRANCKAYPLSHPPSLFSLTTDRFFLFHTTTLVWHTDSFIHM